MYWYKVLIPAEICRMNPLKSVFVLFIPHPSSLRNRRLKAGLKTLNHHFRFACCGNHNFFGRGFFFCKFAR